LQHCETYHNAKESISLINFDHLLDNLQERVTTSNFLTTIEELKEILVETETIIKAPLPQQWEVAFERIIALPESPRAMLNFMHCPKGVHNGGQKTSCSGLAKALGPESALYGMTTYL